MTYWTVPQMWAGQTVAILASGPSMNQMVADMVGHLPRIAVNTTYQLARDADVIYASDLKWWAAHPEALTCPGIKASIEVRPGAIDATPGVVYLRNTGRYGFDPRPDCARTLNNSGGVALQIAVKAKAARVLLLGFDMRGGHWHPGHPKHNPASETFARWVAAFARMAKSLPKSVEVLNCTPGSALSCFPRATLAEVL